MLSQGHKKIKVSIIIPNYNKGRFLFDCIASCLNQTYRNIEIIVVDDCSTDDSCRIIKNFSSQGLITPIFLKENHGVSFARNIGAQTATGDFLTFLDSDDVYVNDRKIENEVALVRGEKDIAFSQWVSLDENGDVLNPILAKKNVYRGKAAIAKILSITEPGYRQLRGYLFSKRLFQEVGGYDFPMNLYEDFYLQCKLVLHGRLRYSGQFGEGYRQVSGPRLSRQSPSKAEEAISLARSLILASMSPFQKLFYRWRMSRGFGIWSSLWNKLRGNCRQGNATHKILYWSDFALDAPNSVAEMLDNIQRQETSAGIMLGSQGERYCYRQLIHGVPHYRFSNEKDEDGGLFAKRSLVSFGFLVFLRKLFKRIGLSRFGNRVQLYILASQICFLARKLDADHVLSVAFFPSAALRLSGVSYSVLLYDTILGRPGVSKRAIASERKVIERSWKYYVPEFFSEEYQTAYPGKRQLSFIPLPFLPTEAELEGAKAYSSPKRYRFAYFGQLQSFRNCGDVFSLFARLGWNIDLFSKDDPGEWPNVICHGAIAPKDCLAEMASSSFLLVFDNNPPFDRYLPSKCYQMIALGRPVIVLGKNRNSATREFFAGQGNWVYVDLEDAGAQDKLASFVSQAESVANRNDGMTVDGQVDRESIVRRIHNDIRLAPRQRRKEHV